MLNVTGHSSIYVPPFTCVHPISGNYKLLELSAWSLTVVTDSLALP